MENSHMNSMREHEGNSIKVDSQHDRNRQTVEEMQQANESMNQFIVDGNIVHFRNLGYTSATHQNL